MPDRYEFLRKIAQGGFGRVYVAKDTILGREVAIKRLLSPEESASHEQGQATFEREATTLAAMQHPNIVQVFDFDRDEEGTFVVMEMLEGETLKDRLNRGPLTWETFVNVARQSLDAINAAHLKGILHRDLKPENLFLHRTAGGTRVLKILDFGLAKLSNVPSRQTMDQSGNVFGSIYYMAPEQFMREPLDGRTDLYALGCVFYQALTGRFPFHGDNMQGNMEAHMQHEVKPIRERRPDLSATVSDWLMRLISFLPADRPPDAMTALREFEAALEGKTLQPARKALVLPPITSRPVPPLPNPARSGAGQTSRPGNPPSARPSPSGTRPTGSEPPFGATKAPMQRRPIGAVEASRADAQARLDAVAKRKRLALMIGVPVAVVAVLAFIFMRSGSKKSTSTANPTATTTPQASGTSTKAPAATPKAPDKAATATAPKVTATTPKVTATTTKAPAAAAPAPAPKAAAPPPGPPLPEPLALALPMEASLAWRFRAGVESRHKTGDGKFDPAKLQRGQTVQFWKNLASAENSGALSLYEGKAQRAPAGQLSEEKMSSTSHTCLRFSPGSGMEMKFKSTDAAQAPGGNAADPAGVTVAVVLRATANSTDTTMRPLLLTSDDAKQNFSLHFTRAGQYTAVVEKDGQKVQSLATPEEFTKRKEGSGGSWVVVIGQWDAQQGAVSLRVRSADGKAVAAPPLPSRPGCPR